MKYGSDKEMSYLKEKFFSEVLQNIKSKEVKNAVFSELNQHINSSKQTLMVKGLTDIEAEKLAIKQMGNPMELGAKFKKLYRPLFDWKLFSVFLVMIFMGILPVIHTPGDFVLQRIIMTILGVVTVIAFMLLDYRILYKRKWLILSLACFTMLWIIFLPNEYINGKSYLTIGNISISGLIVLPLYLLFWSIHFSQKTLHIFSTLLLLTINLYLYILLADFVPLLLFCIVWSVLLLTSKTEIKSKVLLIFSLLLVVSTFIFVTFNIYQIDRLKSVLGFQRNGDNYIVSFLRDLLGSAGWFGNNKVPEHFMELHTDMAFVNITYFYGWIVSLFLLVCIITLLFRVCFISLNTKDIFGRLLVIGIVTILISQFVYNISMMVGLVPYIPMSLPFISYGFGPTVVNSILIGLVLSVYRRKNITTGLESYS